MQLMVGSVSIDSFTYLRDVLTAEILDYINRVGIFNETDPSKFDAFLKTIEQELMAVALNRKFLVLNTNVVRETHQRVIGNSTLRSFYIELMTSLMARITMELDLNTAVALVRSISTSYSRQVIKLKSGTGNPLIEQSPEYKQFVGQLAVMPSLATYLEDNEWYYGIILCNYFATYLLNQLAELRSTENNTSRGPNVPKQV